MDERGRERWMREGGRGGREREGEVDERGRERWMREGGRGGESHLVHITQIKFRLLEEVKGQ